MQSLQQIRDREESGQKEVSKAEAEAQKITAAAHTKEPEIRKQIAAEMDDRENTLAEQTLDECKRLIEESKKETARRIKLLETMSQDNMSQTNGHIQKLFRQKTQTI